MVNRRDPDGVRCSCVGAGGVAALAVLSVVLSVAACGSLVGIHPSRDGAVGEAGAGADARTGDGAADRGLYPPDAGGPDAAGGSSASGYGAGARDVTMPPPVLDADPSASAAEAGGQPLGADAFDPGQGGAAVPPPSDAGGSPDPTTNAGDAAAGEAAVCPVIPAMMGTVYQFSAGPNNTKAGSGKCGFPNAKLSTTGRYYGSVDVDIYAAAARCGVCVQATAGGQSVEVEIIDFISKNPTAHGATLAMDAAAIKILSGTTQNIDVQFAFVPCTDPGTIQARFNSTGDASVLILGARNQLASVRMASPGVASVNLTRSDFNVWQPPMTNGFGGSVTLTLTDIYGNALELPDLAVTANFVDSGKQFPAPSCPR